MTARKTLFAALAAATAVAAIAAPAAAQSYGSDRQAYGYDHQSRYEQDRDGDRWNSDRDPARYERDRGYDRWDRSSQIDARLIELRNRIYVGQRRGTLTEREAAALRNDYALAASMVAHMKPDGLTRSERIQITRRLDGLEARVARESRDRDYGYGYGRDRDYDRR